MPNRNRSTARKPPQREQDLLPGIRDYQREQELAIERQIDRVMEMWKTGLSGEKLYTAVMMIFCGLPVEEPEDGGPVVRKTQLPDRSWVRVTFSRSHEHVPLPSGADRTMVYFLTNKAVLQNSPVLQWDCANEYMHLFGMNPDSGKNYRDVQARFIRVAYMNILVEYLDPEGKFVDSWKCPLVQKARIAADTDGEGNWKATESLAKMLDTDQAVGLSPEFFKELLAHPVPIPIEIIKAAGKEYRLMDFLIFLYWRTFAARTESLIPWKYIQQQFDNSDSNIRRWRQKFRKAVNLLQRLPDPISKIKVEILDAGVKVHPLPVGTTFFEDRPKLGFKRQKGTSPLLDEPIPDAVIREYPGAKRLIDPYTGHVYEDSYLVGENNVIVNGKLEYKGQVGVTIVFRPK